jgi:predicted acylesterase/phospholipase RssA
MADPRTVRVLSFDGGGMRGYLSLLWFQKFVQLWGINEADIWKNFDVITGTSIGGIIALALAYGLTPTELLPFFTNDGKWIFTIRSAADVAAGSINASFPSNRPYTVQKIAILGNNDQFYRSVDPASNYGSSRLKTKLIQTFGIDTLQKLKTNVLVTSYRPITQTPVLFSNLNYGEFTGQNELISNVGLATSAAPLYLPPQAFTGNSYIDGGVFQNNPSQLGLTLGKMVKATANRYCVLSVGTGLGKVGFHEEDDPNQPPPPSFPFEQTVKDLTGLIDASIAGAQESVARSLFLESQYTLNKLFTYRFQTVLDPLVDTDLDNSDNNFLTYLNNVATTQFNADADNIATFLGHLMT